MYRNGKQHSSSENTPRISGISTFSLVLRKVSKEDTPYFCAGGAGRHARILVKLNVFHFNNFIGVHLARTSFIFYHSFVDLNSSFVNLHKKYNLTLEKQKKTIAIKHDCMSMAEMLLRSD